jgi:hypothetical protein
MEKACQIKVSLLSINQVRYSLALQLGLKSLPVPKDSVEFNDEVFFVLRKCTSFQVRPQVVHPPQPTALATPLKP